MLALASAVLAGALTTLAPCSLTLLPVIVGGSLEGAGSSHGVRRVWLIAISLGVSVFAFTLLLKATTALLSISPMVWQWISGAVLVLLGLSLVAPSAWDRLTLRLSGGATDTLVKAARAQGIGGAVATGAALGPVFSSCSPLYAYVVVTVLPAELGRGLVLLTAYVVGLVTVLLAVGLAGIRLVRRLGWAANPHGWFRHGIGVLFVLIGVLIATGLMKDLETWVLINSPISPWEWGPELG